MSPDDDLDKGHEYEEGVNWPGAVCFVAGCAAIVAIVWILATH